MKITYFGHSAFQVETRGTTLLIDPFITGNPLAEGVVAAADLRPDVILLTHAHGDHWGDTAEIATRTGALVVANYEIATYLQSRHDHQNVMAMNTGGSWVFPWGKVTQTYARHSSSFPDGTYGGNPNGFLIEAEGRCLYAMGDTSPFAEMAWIGEEHQIDVAFMPVGDCFTMGTRGSLRAAELIGAQAIVPVHYNTFPPIETDIQAWATEMSEAGFHPEVLMPGETMGLEPV